MNEPQERTSRSQALPCGIAVLVFGAFCYWAVSDLIESRGPMTNDPFAIGSLKVIGTAQILFRGSDREGDENHDYGTLAELGSGDRPLLDAVLASGTKQGYLFAATYGARSSEFLWYATARPVVPGTSGARFYALNHEGVLYFTLSGPFTLNSSDCTFPAGAQVVGK